MSDTTKILLSVAAVAVALLGGRAFGPVKQLLASLLENRPPAPLPPPSGGGSPAPGVWPTPAVPDFVAAVRAVDGVIAYLVETEQYGPAQQQAARVLRAAVVEGATPPVPPGVEATKEVS